MGLLCFSGLVVFCLIGFIGGAPHQGLLSPHEPSTLTTSDSQKLQKENENGSYNEDIAKILQTLAKNNLKNIGSILAKVIGEFFRRNPQTKPFAGIAEKAAQALANYLADHVSARVYEVTKSIRSYDLKIGGISDLKQIVNRAIMSSKEQLKLGIARAIEKKAEELKKKAGKWNEILADISQDKIARIPGVDEELSKAIRKVIENAGEDLAKEAYQKLKSPEKDKIMGKLYHAYNGAVALAKASGEKISAIARAVADLQSKLVNDFTESDEFFASAESEFFTSAE